MMDSYTSDSSDSDSHEQKTLDYSQLMLSVECLEENLSHLDHINKLTEIETVLLNNNLISRLSSHTLIRFNNLHVLDLSANGLAQLPRDLLQICPLTRLILKNNLLTNNALPKCFKPNSSDGSASTLRELNLSGNLITHFPDAVLELNDLKYLYLGGNKIETISKDIWKLQSLNVLSLGGNQIIEVPDTVGNLHQLQALSLSDNLIEVLPSSIARLSNLKSLSLHKNRIRHLPRDIITLKNLVELSLRENPLIVRFVQEISLNPPSLLELAARVIRTSGVLHGANDLPKSLCDYLSNAHCCVNPKCKGVFFDNRIEHIKFVDFCGKYRVPLLQYLCSSKCIEPMNRSQCEPEPSSSSNSASGFMMRKVLLG